MEDRKFTPNPAFVNSNPTFYCKNNRCDQLSGYNTSTGVQDELATYFTSSDGGAGKIFDNPKAGYLKIECDTGAPPTISRLPKAKTRELQAKFRNGTLEGYSVPDNIRKPEYAFKLGDEYIYVDASKLNYQYESFRFFKGKKGALKEFKVKSVERFRDGGTTRLTLEDNRVLFVPTSSKESDTFEGQELNEIIPKESNADSLPAGPCPAPVAKAAGKAKTKSRETDGRANTSAQ